PPPPTAGERGPEQGLLEAIALGAAAADSYELLEYGGHQLDGPLPVASRVGGHRLCHIGDHAARGLATFLVHLSELREPGGGAIGVARGGAGHHERAEE